MQEPASSSSKDSPTFTLSTEFYCSQREFIADIAFLIYQNLGYTAPTPKENVMYFFESQHPTEKACLNAAEQIFERLWDDWPDYDDECE